MDCYYLLRGKIKKGNKRRMIKVLVLLFILLLILYQHQYYNNEIHIKTLSVRVVGLIYGVT